MIRVVPAPEPPSFDLSVRQPGLEFLGQLDSVEEVNFSGREYWRRCLTDLHSAYRSICAYTCHWISLDTGSDTVEHFIPKSTNPPLAYEWRNFRLVCGRLNGRKGNHTDVVDPFVIVDETFVIDFPSLQVMAGNGIPEDCKALAESTIQRLKLNDERCIRARLAYVEEFRDRHIDFDFLARHAPFLARELVRQGIRDNIGHVMPSND